MRRVIGLLAALFMSPAFGGQAVIEVPGAQKVRDAIRSGSARDRLARQSAAAFVLVNVVRVQAGERLKSGGLTAAAAIAMSATHSIDACRPTSSRRRSIARSTTDSSVPRRRNRCRRSW